MTTLCPNCRLPHSELPGDTTACCSGAQAEAMQSLLRNIGDLAQCSGCHALIYWVKHRNGKQTPYETNGLNHFISCPRADQFRKKVF